MRKVISDNIDIHIPRPGVPLLSEIDEANQRLMDEELSRRIELMRARLSMLTRLRLMWRQRRISRTLTKKRYNEIVERVERINERIEYIKKRWNNVAPSVRRLYSVELKQLVKERSQLSRKVQHLMPIAHEFESISQRISADLESRRWLKEDKENYRAFRREALTWLEQMECVFRNSERTRHRWQDSDGNWHVDIPKFERIIFTDDRVYYHVRTSSQTLLERMVGRWHSDLPDSVDVTDLTCDETLANLSAACRRRVSYQWSQRGTNLYYVISRLDSPDGIPARVMWSALTDWYPREEHHKAPWFAGVTNDRKVVTYDFEEQPHVLIAGSTQSGKSNHINQMIATLASMNSPDECVFVLVDLKGGVEFSHWRGLRHNLVDIVKSADGAISSLRFVRRLMETRLNLLETRRVKNLASYNARYRRIPRVVVIIDELATLIGLDTTKEFHTLLRVISSQGRAAGVHLVLCTQHASVDVLPGWIKTNMVLRVSGRMPSASASQVVLDTVTAATIPSVPGRMVFSTGRFETICQSPLILDTEIERVVRNSQSYPEPLNEVTFDDEITTEEVAAKTSEVTESDIVKLAIERYGGRLVVSEMWRDGVLQGRIGWHDLLRLSAHVRQKVDEQGYVEHDGVRYQVKKTRGGGRIFFSTDAGATIAPESAE